LDGRRNLKAWPKVRLGDVLTLDRDGAHAFVAAILDRAFKGELCINNT
jgi:hypothetical protein